MMKKMTEENAKGALAGESQAHIRYLAFAEAAAAEKLPNTARIFKAAAFSEQVHATNHLRTLSGVGPTKDNLAAAAAGENFEVEEMYPAYIAVAQSQGEKTAEFYFNAALQAEKVHRGLYQAARKAVEAGRDASAAPVHVCSMCGFTVEGTAPDKCPVCGAPREKFVAF
jgi:rubrerythrin